MVNINSLERDGLRDVRDKYATGVPKIKKKIEVGRTSLLEHGM